jgi:hypothetical protein
LKSESPNTATPTGAQLHEARLLRWHQTGEALLTVENLRSWINASGIILFAPRPQIVAPGPTMVEAVLGAPNGEPTLAAIAETRKLLARLVAEGIAVPLNLMGAHGTPGDTPDFVVSAAVFSYIFTLRGDKAWKQPPVTSGPIKVSNLALATYEMLSSKGAMSAYDLATQLGKEVTEAACLRALNELWIHLRVIPLLQPDGSGTVWEVISARFTKQIKAGANAGQPTAISALISLYLGQAIVASEAEIESFLSPLAPRSRIREVAHTLLNARQLETLVVEGKTLLHVAGEAPSFASPAAEPAQAERGTDQAEATSVAAPSEDGSRITKYIPRPRKIGTGYLSKGKPAAAKRPFDRGDSRSRSADFKPRAGARDERERRPFRKPAEGASDRRFDRPWEEKKPRRFAQADGEARPPRKPRATGDGKPFERREPRSGPRPGRDEGRPERRPRREDEGRSERPRRDFDRGPAAGSFQKRPVRRDRDARESGAGQERPAFRRFDAPKGDRSRDRQRPAGDRPQSRQRSGESDRRSPRRDGDFKTGSPRRQGEFKPRAPRREGGVEGRPPHREGGSRPPRRESGFEGSPRREGGFASRPPRREPNFEGRPAKKQGGNRPFGKFKSGVGAGKFAKSPVKKKPFPKKPSDRTFRPRRDESA